ncbi:MAG: hypothetical protein WGN25_14525 [Candidatus Electrothrix sp. GW3-4]|uniref:hypothetical protein n=1 Tax=Candidatus Electrothrix sp. GW3-4 TaxID=3126740 RepID=UPI0030D2AB29
MKKMIYCGLLLMVLSYTAFVNQAAAAFIQPPISATDPLIADPVSTVVGSPDVVTMRNNVRTSVMATQSTVDTTAPVGEQLPMQAIMIPVMQGAIMPELMQSLSDPTNLDGLVHVFAPTEFQ